MSSNRYTIVIKNVVLCISIVMITLATYYIGVSTAKFKTQSEIDKNTESIEVSNIETIKPQPEIQVQKEVEKPNITTTQPEVKAPTPVIQQVESKETYINQYYNNLKIVYNKDWKFTTTTQANKFYPGLLDRKINLTKNNHELQIFLTPLFTSGCHGNTNEKGFYISNELQE
ncbi:MAG: hypothetical protein ACRCXZ_01545, partial [Patescibacteria group bacterium]